MSAMNYVRTARRLALWPTMIPRLGRARAGLHFSLVFHNYQNSDTHRPLSPLP